VVWHSSWSVGVCALPPFGFEGSRPGSCPGCQAGLGFIVSGSENVFTVFDRVGRRFTIGEGPKFTPDASERASEGLPRGVVGGKPASASTSKCAFRVGDDIVDDGWKSFATVVPSAITQWFRMRYLWRLGAWRGEEIASAEQKELSKPVNKTRTGYLKKSMQ